MRKSLRRWGAGAGAALLVLVFSAAEASAQRPTVRGTMPGRPATPPAVGFYPRSYYQPFSPFATLPPATLPVNPNYLVAPGLTINQYAYNLSTVGRALGNVPPYAFGYNPYPAIANYGPVYQVPPLYNPFMNPYAGAFGGAYFGNPYLGP